MSEEEFQRAIPQHSIEDHEDGTYTLNVDGSPVVKIDWLSGQRVCRWQTYGPADLDRSIALMKGFLHLTALLGNEKRVHASQPAALENDGKSTKSTKEERKWQTSKTTRRSKRS